MCNRLKIRRKQNISTPFAMHIEEADFAPSCNCDFTLSSNDPSPKAVNGAQKQEYLDTRENLLADKWQEVIDCYFPSIAPRIRRRLTLVVASREACASLP